MNFNIEIFKKKSIVKKKTFEIDADFYWKIILYASFVLIVAGASFGFYVFKKVNKEADIALNPTSGKIGTVRKERLDKVLEVFRGREARSYELLNSKLPVVDPSR